MKIMTMADVTRLRGDPPCPKTTHLARFELANDQGAENVLRVECPHCGAKPRDPCANN